MQARNAELCGVEEGRGGQLSQELLTCLPRSRGARPPPPHLDPTAHHPPAARFLTEPWWSGLGLQENLVLRGVLAVGSSAPCGPVPSPPCPWGNSTQCCSRQWTHSDAKAVGRLPEPGCRAPSQPSLLLAADLRQDTDLSRPQYPPL